MDDVLIAAVCHEANRMYCLALGDPSQEPWMGAPAWQRDSAIAGVAYRRTNPEATPAEMHARWLERKQTEGWVYGPVKDVEAKTHPCCLPYEQLPPEQRVGPTVLGDRGRADGPMTGRAVASGSLPEPRRGETGGGAPVAHEPRAGAGRRARSGGLDPDAPQGVSVGDPPGEGMAGGAGLFIRRRSWLGRLRRAPRLFVTHYRFVRMAPVGTRREAILFAWTGVRLLLR